MGWSSERKERWWARGRGWMVEWQQEARGDVLRRGSGRWCRGGGGGGDGCDGSWSQRTMGRERRLSGTARSRSDQQIRFSPM
jgi:hypothetical protein